MSPRATFIAPLFGLVAVASACQKDDKAAPAPAPSSSSAAVTTASASDAAAPAAAAADAADADAAANEVDAGPPPPGRWRKVLQIGDSMVGYHRGLSMALEKRFKAAGVTFYSQSWTSEAVQTLSENDKIEKILKYYKPDAVLLNLGTNNLAVPHPEAYAGNVQKIVKKLAGLDCYWISPPTPQWKWNPRMIDVLRENVAPCKFFDSTPLKLDTQTDHIHPTDKGGEVWAAAFWDFMLTGKEPEKHDGG